MKASEQGMAGRLERFESNFNKGLNHRLSLTLASNQPGEVDMAGMPALEDVETMPMGTEGMESLPMKPLRKRRRRKISMGIPGMPKMPKIGKPRLRK